MCERKKRQVLGLPLRVPPGVVRIFDTLGKTLSRERNEKAKMDYSDSTTELKEFNEHLKRPTLFTWRPMNKAVKLNKR